MIENPLTYRGGAVDNIPPRSRDTTVNNDGKGFELLYKARGNHPSRCTEALIKQIIRFLGL